MYQVIELESFVEPWWFLDGWQRDIVAEADFTYLAPAQNFYEQSQRLLTEKYESCLCQKSHLTAFWNQTDCVWCEACAEELQLYHGLILLEDWQEINSTKR